MSFFKVEMICKLYFIHFRITNDELNYIIDQFNINFVKLKDRNYEIID